MLLIAPEINVILLLDFITLCFLSISIVTSFKVALKWDINSTTPIQYQLEKKSYLISTIIKFVFIIKIMVFPYFIMTIDILSSKIPGAMCASGVFGASIYGYYLLSIKIITLFYFGLWLSIHHYDTKCEDSPYTKGKFKLLLLICFIFIFEMILEIAMFKDIDPGKIVSCCGTLFGGNTIDTLSQTLTKPNNTMIIFYISVIFLFITYTTRASLLYLIACTILLATSIISLIYFFSSYIYQLPIHKCPFCLIQSDYYYMGYGIYLLLFGGVFSGIYYGLLSHIIDDNLLILKNISIILLLSYITIISTYPITYYLKNGVWLW